jgi:hypothetical protein
LYKKLGGTQARPGQAQKSNTELLDLLK